MKIRGKSVICFLLMGVMLLTSSKTVQAQGITGQIMKSSTGEKYEYVVQSWYVSQEPADGVQVLNPKQCGEALTPGMEREVNFNASYSVSTEITRETSTKLSAGLSIPIDKLTASFQTEFNYKVSGTKKESYSQSISKKEKVSFSEAMAAQGYNTCVPYVGIVYNTCNVTVDIYKVKQYSHRHWFLGKKHTHTERGDFVKTVTIQAKQPIVVSFLKYMKVSLKNASVNVYLNNKDTVILGQVQTK